MKAIVQTGKESVETQERDRPVPDSGEALIKVHAAGVCGSDVHSYLLQGGYEDFPLPRVLGHEYAGTVVEVSHDVVEFEKGDQVVEEPIHDCGKCFQCKNQQPNVCRNVSITGAHTDGALTEYTTVEVQHLHRVPPAVPLDVAANTEPTSIAARAVITQSRAGPGDRVLVEGPGPIGLLVALVAEAIGANVIVSGIEKDTTYRLPLAEQLGLETVNVAEVETEHLVETETDGLGFDIVFDTTGHASGIKTAVESVRRGGQIVVVGLPGESSELFFTPLVRGEVDINTSYGSTWQNFEQSLRLMAEGMIDTSELVDVYDIDRPEEAFADFLNSRTCKPLFYFGDRGQE